MKKLLVFVAVLAIPLAAYAAVGSIPFYQKYGKVLDGVTMEAARTFTKAVALPETNGTPDLTVLWACLTDINDTLSSISWTCSVSHDSGTHLYKMQATNSSAGTSTYTDWTGTHAMPSYPTAKCWPIRLDTAGFPYVSCTFTPNTTGQAADLLTVYLSYATK